jgi:hypothetical protein
MFVSGEKVPTNLYIETAAQVAEMMQFVYLPYREKALVAKTDSMSLRVENGPLRVYTLGSPKATCG